MAYMQALRRPFMKLCRLRFLNPDGSTALFPGQQSWKCQEWSFIADGTISVNLQNGQRRNATVTISNVDGAFDYNINKIWFGQEIVWMKG